MLDPTLEGDDGMCEDGLGMTGQVRKPGGSKTREVAVSVSRPEHASLRGVLTVLSGARGGMPIALGQEPVVVGRTDEASVVMDDDSLSRRHARFFKVHGSHLVEDLQSTNGTFVNGERLTEPRVLQDGDRLQLGRSTILRFTMQDDTELDAARDLYESTVRDGLTGVFNRPHFDARVRAELARATREGRPLSLLFVDADHFKQINDTHGHAVGDEVLRAIGRGLADTVRLEDLVARYGGEEFVVLLPGIGEDDAMAAAERIRRQIEDLRVEHEGGTVAVTVSVGIASSSPAAPVGDVAELIRRADAAVYRAKESGRNRVHGG